VQIDVFARAVNPVFVQPQPPGLGERRALQRVLAGEHEREQRSDRVDVGPLVDARRLELLGAITDGVPR